MLYQRSRGTRSRRRGAILALLAITLIPLLGFMALAIDIGMIALAQSDTQDAADTVTMAAVRAVNTSGGFNAPDVNARVSELVASNSTVTTSEGTKTISTLSHLNRRVRNVVIGTSTVPPGENGGRFGFWRYNAGTGKFEGTYASTLGPGDIPTLIHTQIISRESDGSNIPASGFGQLMGLDRLAAFGEAIAIHRPRDVMFVFDLSGSMSYGSRAIPGNNNGFSRPFMNSDDIDLPEFGHYSNASFRNVMFRTTSSNGQNPANLTDVSPAADRSFVEAFFQDDTYNTPAFEPPINSNVLITNPEGDRPLRRNLNNPAQQFAINVSEVLGTSPSNDNENTRRIGVGSNPNAATWESQGYDWAALNTGGFRGYTRGPRYLGKTFFIWPPDPREDKDWRKKFFYPDPATRPANLNQAIFGSSNGFSDSLINNNYRNINPNVNYQAILDWLKQPPQTVPPALYAGRIAYYTQIPDNCLGNTPNERFWRYYINYVLDNRINANFHGDEDLQWGSTSTRVSPNPTGPNASYMDYRDNPKRPVLRGWFGALTMITFINLCQNELLALGSGNPGTAAEAQNYHLKLGVQSALDSIERNYPNDIVGMCYFSAPNTHPDTAAPLSNNFFRLREALWFPANTVRANDSEPIVSLPWMDNSGNGLPGVPRGEGNTTPEMGFMLAFNQLSANKGHFGSKTRAGGNGRRGAQKMVVFLTDGLPNGTAGGSPVSVSGGRSYYNNPGGSGSGDPAAEAVNVVARMALDENSGGLSTPARPVRVHAFGFGDLFENGEGGSARTFLLNVQKAGNTSLPTDTAIPPYKIITGTFQQRVDALQEGLRATFQDGITLAFVH